MEDLFILNDWTENVFCATGPGGGVDPTCPGGGRRWGTGSPYEPDYSRLQTVMGKSEFLEKKVKTLLKEAGEKGVPVPKLVKKINGGGTVYGSTNANELAAVLETLEVEWSGESVRSIMTQ